MGAYAGFVKGKSKLATWKAYLTEVGALATPQGQDEQNMWVQFPRNKKDAYERMEPLAEGGWTLYYRFHS